MNKFTLFKMPILSALPKIPDNSVDVIITSPPYWHLRNYQGSETEWGDGSVVELGGESTYQLYLDHLLEITNELKRVLKPTGSMWWNCGDTYSSSEKIGISPKSRMMLPERFATRLIDEQRWILRNTIIWAKNSLPSPMTDRLTCSYEHVFFFTKKSKDYYFNLNAIRNKKTYPNTHVKEICENIYNEAKQMRNQNKLLSYEGKHKVENSLIQAGIIRSGAGALMEFLVALRTVGRQTILNHPELSTKDKEYVNWFMHNGGGNPEGSNPGDIWNINTESMDEEHYAAFPTELVQKILLASGPEKGVVLDPFMGSGTTAKVGLDMNMNVIGCEIVEKYCKIIERRTKIKEREKLGSVEYASISSFS